MQNYTFFPYPTDLSIKRAIPEAGNKFKQPEMSEQPEHISKFAPNKSLEILHRKNLCPM